MCALFYLYYFQIVKQKFCLLPENLDQLSNLNIGLALVLLPLDWYLFLLIVLLKLDFNCYNSSVLSSVYIVITGT